MLNAEKCRKLADWLDTMTAVCIKYLMLCPATSARREALDALNGSEVQDDLREFANLLESGYLDSIEKGWEKLVLNAILSLS